jgi:hypothetical protein
MVNQPKTVFTSEGYHVVFTINISLNRIAVRLEGNIDKYAESGSVPARLICGRYRSMGLLVRLRFVMYLNSCKKLAGIEFLVCS